MTKNTAIPYPLATSNGLGIAPGENGINKMDEKVQSLVVTPPNHPTESLLGYALRVTERNGYATPRPVMVYAGVSPEKIDTTGFSHEKLALVLGKDASDLEPIAYRKVSSDGKSEFRLLGHSLDKSLRYRPLRLAEPQFCKYCVRENGYLDAYWDLRLVVACPVHRCTLVHTCPTCGKKIKWFRPGILACKCGTNLEDAITENVNDDVVSMMAIIQAKLHNTPMSSFDNSFGLPIDELDKLSLSSLLVLIDALGQHNMQAKRHRFNEPMIIVQSAIEVLRDWPNNFHELIRRAGSENDQSRDQTTGLRKRYEKFYLPLFKRHRPLVGCEFLWKEFVRFGLEVWGEGVVDNKMLRGERLYKRFVSLSEQATRMGIRPKTLKRWSELGFIQKITINAGKQKRFVIDSNSVRLRKTKGTVLGEREAAALVGLPVGVLISLRNSGHYKVRHVTKRLKCFHEIDLKLFIRLVRSMGKVVVDNPMGSIILGDVMRLKFRNEEGKADFIREVLSKKMEVIGRAGNSPQDLLFNRKKVELFLRDKRAASEDHTWSLSETAKYLGCDPAVLPTIIDEGLLESVEVKAGTRVSEKSIKDFEVKFVSAARLAKEIGTSSRRLQEELYKQDIPLRTFRRVYGVGNADQPFVSREYDNLITGILENLKSISTAAEIHPSSVTLIRRYLDGLRSREKLLPRRDGKPNKAEIAKACGFNRKILYLNSEVLGLLDDFDREEKHQDGAKVKADGMTALRNYLNELDKYNLQLPRSGGKPNKSLIAKTCGVDRNLFYTRPEAISLLNSFNSGGQV